MIYHRTILTGVVLLHCQVEAQKTVDKYFCLQSTLTTKQPGEQQILQPLKTQRTLQILFATKIYYMYIRFGHSPSQKTQNIFVRFKLSNKKKCEHFLFVLQSNTLFSKHN